MKKDLDKQEEIIDKKEEKKFEEIIPYGLMIGAIVGFVIDFNTNDFMWVPVGCIAGIVLSVILGSILSHNGKEKKK